MLPNDSEIESNIEDDLSCAYFEVLCTVFQISAERLAEAIGISSIVLNQCRLENRFSSVEFVRLARLYRLFSDSVSALGSEAAAGAWFVRSRPRFDGLAPLEFAATESGYQEICCIVEQIENYNSVITGW